MIQEILYGIGYVVFILAIIGGIIYNTINYKENLHD